MSIEIQKGKLYLVTGGSGFLGNELIERLVLKGARVRCMARNEGLLVKLMQNFPNIEIVTGDIADKVSCSQAVKGVDGVFHLAASKHVGIAEKLSRECVNSNIIGSLNLLESCLENKPEFIIGISTDKAAQVKGVYGASKFLMEKLFEQFARINEHTQHRIVRYGNVMYSTGSVMCKWKDLISKGEQCTITDPNATRFYWTVDQAVDLIFQCLESATSALPFCPTMKSVRMGDLWEAMCLRYFTGKPIEQPKFIGLQPGENLHEIIHEGAPNSFDAPRYSVEELVKLV